MKLVLLVSFLLVIQIGGQQFNVEQQPCLEMVLQETNCACFKYPSYPNRASVQCSFTTLQKFQKALSHTGSESVFELQIRETDLHELNGVDNSIPQETIGEFLHTLKFEDVNMGVVQLKKLIEPLQALKHLVFDKADIPMLGKEDLGNMQHLEILVLDSDRIAEIEDGLFDVWRLSLKELSLRDNELKTFPNALRGLFLTHLDLIDNNIQTLTKEEQKWITEDMRELNQLKMNKLKCTCQFFKDGPFVKWVQAKNFEEVFCATGKPITQMTEKDFCPSKTGDGYGGGPGGAGTILTSGFLIVTSLCILIFRH